MNCISGIILLLINRFTVLPEHFIHSEIIIKMRTRNPHALYINCDGAMDYDSKNHGGIGFVIQFPDHLNLDSISHSMGRYSRVNIERIEIEALNKAFSYVIDIFREKKQEIRSIKRIIFVTDRFGLSDEERTNPYKIRSWRQNKWKNFEGKPIKNHELLDELDKYRKRLSDLSGARISIEYHPRKQNKAADKLAKAGKKEGLIIDTLLKKAEKIGRRKFDGHEIAYKLLKAGDEIHVNVFRKDPVQEEWEIWVEVCEGEKKGQKLKIYIGNELAAKLQRGNQYILRLKKVFRFHVEIFKTIKKISKIT